MKKLFTVTSVVIIIINLLVIVLGNWNIENTNTQSGILFSPTAAFTDPFEGAMVYVEGGSFMMGGNHEKSYEKPVHQVTVNSFHMAASEVTQAQWRAVMGTDPSKFMGCDDCPVEEVSWEDAQVFIQKLNDKTGKQYRLPTEAEWEYAAKGGVNQSPYIYSGSDNVESVAWHEDNSGGKTHPVKSKNPNALGLYDMSGNVFEWCQDTRHDNYNDAPTDGSAWEDQGDFRVVRGGSWLDGSGNCRVADRVFGTQGGQGQDICGFRLACPN